MSIILYNACVWKTVRKGHYTAVSNDLYIIDSVRKYWLATCHQPTSSSKLFLIRNCMTSSVSNDGASHHMHCIVQ